MRLSSPLRRRRARKDMERRLGTRLPKEPQDWFDAMEELPVVEI